MGFATVGYQRAPAGLARSTTPSPSNSAAAWSATSTPSSTWVPPGYVGLLNSSLHGFTGNVGLSLNL